jgi:secondary thiamine-phosphate synthase enzyme
MIRKTVSFSTHRKEQLVDVTEQLRTIARSHPEAVLMSLFSKGATSAVMIQENWDPNIQVDILDCLAGLVPSGKWRHDSVDGNADSHIKAGIVGPSEVIPLDSGELLLGRWQNVFFCDFDGPRTSRELIVTLT